MRISTIVTMTFFVLGTSATAEVVTLTDGRAVDLKDDGTYAFIEPASASDSDFVEFKEPFFEHHTGEYSQNYVRFMPVFKNISEKKILGVKFSARFLNPFGDEIVSFSADSDEAVSPGKTSTHNIFYNFEDNPFINGETYDKLLPMVTNKTGSVEVTLDMIAFEGGEIVKLSK